MGIVLSTAEQVLLAAGYSPEAARELAALMRQAAAEYRTKSS